MSRKKMECPAAEPEQGRAVVTICTSSKNGTSRVIGAEDWELDVHPTGMSVPEKTLLCHLLAPAPALPYPLLPLKMMEGPDAQEYQIPETEREKVFQEQYPFVDCPRMDDIRFDLHEQKRFVVREYRLIRECGRNFIVSPYYPHSGGMVVDWMDEGAENAAMRFEKLQPKRK